MQYGDVLREFREEAGYSREDLADYLRVATETLARWERSERKLDVEKALELANLYGITVEQLIGATPASPTNVAAVVNSFPPETQTVIIKMLRHLKKELGV